MISQSKCLTTEAQKTPGSVISSPNYSFLCTITAEEKEKKSHLAFSSNFVSNSTSALKSLTVIGEKNESLAKRRVTEINIWHLQFYRFYIK